MAESTQQKLLRVRPPRVKITYDVEAGDAIEMRELPFVAGIMADLSGHREEKLPPLKERKFVELDRDNFNDIMASIGPRLALRVDNQLTDDDTKMNVELKFQDIDDFHPANLIHQVEPLRKLYEARLRLNDLLAKLDGNDDLDALLQDIVNNTDGLQEIQQEVEARKDEESEEEGQAEPEPSDE